MSMKREFDIFNFTKSDAKRYKGVPLSFEEVKEIIEKDENLVQNFLKL